MARQRSAIWHQTADLNPFSSYLFMTPGFTFLAGIFLLALFGWSFRDKSRPPQTHPGHRSSPSCWSRFCLTTLYPPDKTIRLGLDLQGGTSFLIRLSPEGERSISADTLDQAVEVIRKRVDQFGVSEPVITPQGADRILVQIPGLDPEQIAAARQQLAQVAKLGIPPCPSRERSADCTNQRRHRPGAAQATASKRKRR